MTDKKTVSKAQQRATAKYKKVNYDRTELLLPKGKKAALQEHATGMGESLNGFVNRAIDETVERDTTACVVCKASMFRQKHLEPPESYTCSEKCRNEYAEAMGLPDVNETVSQNVAKLCPMCNTQMTQLRSTKTYCSSSCRAKAHKKRKSNEVDQMDLLD